MIHSWIEAIGDASPVYTDADFAAASVHRALVAPPAMIQVWTMPGLRGRRPDDDPLSAMSLALDEAGFTSVVATNCDQVYHRYLRHGEQVRVRASLLDVTGPKRTALGEGWFVTTRSTWYAGDEPVAAMDFRILKFPPAGTAGHVRCVPGHSAAGIAGHRVLLGRDRGRGTADPAVRELRRAAPSAGADVPPLR